MDTAQRVLLIVSGGIAAYKVLEVIRLLRKAGLLVRCVLTKGGAEFVTPLSLAALSEDKVFQDLFSLTDEAEMGHIELSRQADLVVVAPASADILAKMAAGMANDLATTILLATDKPVMVAPAMNVRMWEHAATQANIAVLKQRGVTVIDPDEGAMACGEFGPGRLVEPAVLTDHIMSALKVDTTSKQLPLSGRSFLVTAGPTHEPIDPVRYIANRSSGKQGYAIAAALATRGADVTLVSGPTQLASPPGVNRVNVESAQDMLTACQEILPVDASIFAAAVADWRVENQGTGKLKKTDGGPPPSLSLVENPDILKTISGHPKYRPGLVVGFAAETENVVEKATAKRLRKGCDWILANDVSDGTGTFGGERNQVHLINDSGCETWPEMTKDAVADMLADRIIQYFDTVTSTTS